jgi:voltage-gated potassium channel
LHYARSFFGIVDLLAIVPTYAAFLVPNAQAFLVVRTFRLLRVFRIFKLAHFVSEAAALRRAFAQSRAKVTVFLAAVLVLVAITGSTLYLVEGGQPDSGFGSIPASMYWAVVTMTTVGYGDISPQTPIGKTLAALVMVLGYSLIVVPTGIITAELTAHARSITTRSCTACGRDGHDIDATHCKYCGEKL